MMAILLRLQYYVRNPEPSRHWLCRKRRTLLLSGGVQGAAVQNGLSSVLKEVKREWESTQLDPLPTYSAPPN